MGTFVPEASGDPNPRQFDAKFVEIVNSLIAGSSGILIPFSLFDAKGDLIIGTGPDAGSKVPVGADGKVLSADSTQPNGVKWIATPTDNPPSCKAYRTANFTVASGPFTPVPLTAEAWDTDGMHSNAVNPARFTCVTAGLYHFLGQLSYAAASAVGQRWAAIRVTKVDTTQQYLGDKAFKASDYDVSTGATLDVSALLKLAVGDYVELLARQDSGGGIDIAPDGDPVNNPYGCSLSCVRLGTG